MRRILLFAIVGKVQSKPIRNYRIEIYRLPSRLIKYISDISQSQIMLALFEPINILYRDVKNRILAF